MDGFEFTASMSVRDYECDMQGIVNNAVYQNYLEHVRHEYLKSIGIDFQEYTSRGIHLVVTRAEIDYKRPLRSGDNFMVSLKLRQESKLRFVFYQSIRLLPEQKLAVQAKITGVALDKKGRPHVPPEFLPIFSAREEG